MAKSVKQKNVVTIFMNNLVVCGCPFHKSMIYYEKFIVIRV